MKKVKYAFMAMLLGFPAVSNAALFFEPGITYQSHETTVDWGGLLGNSTGKNIGTGINLRLGTHLSDIVFVGLDGRYALTQFEDSAGNTNSDAKNMDLAPFVGVQMPIVGLRLWASYVAWGEIDPDSESGFDAQLAKANGLRLGVGFHIAMVSLNLEYQDLKYDDVTVGTPLGSFTASDATAKGLTAGVSFPLSF
jgi:Outer membrane protein beta-barrel domain